MQVLGAHGKTHAGDTWAWNCSSARHRGAWLHHAISSRPNQPVCRQFPSHIVHPKKPRKDATTLHLQGLRRSIPNYSGWNSRLREAISSRIVEHAPDTRRATADADRTILRIIRLGRFYFYRLAARARDPGLERPGGRKAENRSAPSAAGIGGEPDSRDRRERSVVSRSNDPSAMRARMASATRQSARPLSP